MINQLVFYHIPTDKIFISTYMETCFYNLMPAQWDEVEILGIL